MGGADAVIAKADTAIKKQGIEGGRATLGHAARGGMGQFIGLADDKGIEGEARIEWGARQFFILGPCRANHRARRGRIRRA